MTWKGIEISKGDIIVHRLEVCVQRRIDITGDGVPKNGMAIRRMCENKERKKAAIRIVQTTSHDECPGIVELIPGPVP